MDQTIASDIGLSVMGENANPNQILESFKVGASPIKPPMSSSVSETQEIESLRPSGDSTPTEDDEDELHAQTDILEHQVSEERRRNAHLAEMNQHLQEKVDKMERNIGFLQRTHAKTMTIKEDDLAALKKSLQAAKDAEDAAKVEAQREKIKRESEFKAKEESYKAEIRAFQNAAGGATGQSFRGGPGAAAGGSFRSFKSFIGMSGKSQKVQQKVQANATERDHARQLKALKDENIKLKCDNEALKQTNNGYKDAVSQITAKVTALEEKLEKYRSRFNKLKNKKKEIEQNLSTLQGQQEDLVLKAGWAAEEVQQLTSDLEYERSKHVKASRMAVINQGDELKKTKAELEKLKKDYEQLKLNPALANATPSKAKPSASSTSAQKPTPSGVSKVHTAPKPTMEEVPLKGTETIAELIALKAKAREAREVKVEAELAKNRQDAKKSDKPTGGIGDLFNKAIGDRRDLMKHDQSVIEEEDDEFLSDSSFEGIE